MVKSRCRKRIRTDLKQRLLQLVQLLGKQPAQLQRSLRIKAKSVRLSRHENGIHRFIFGTRERAGLQQEFDHQKKLQHQPRAQYEPQTSWPTQFLKCHFTFSTDTCIAEPVISQPTR